MDTLLREQRERQEREEREGKENEKREEKVEKKEGEPLASSNPLLSTAQLAANQALEVERALGGDNYAEARATRMKALSVMGEGEKGGEGGDRVGVAERAKASDDKEREELEQYVRSVRGMVDSDGHRLVEFPSDYDEIVSSLEGPVSVSVCFHSVYVVSLVVLTVDIRSPNLIVHLTHGRVSLTMTRQLARLSASPSIVF